MQPLTFISLFAGIGGIDLGLERAGMRCVAQVEIDDYANRVLAKHWPDVPRLRDVRSVGAHNLPRADVIAGGFPCQDISNAGKRAGIDGARSGLWAEYARIICDLRPRYVFVENVSALLVRGLDRVLGDLAALGYDAEWECIPAATIGAPHRRDRLFLVAYAQCAERGAGQSARDESDREVAQWKETAGRPRASSANGRAATMADPGSPRRQQESRGAYGHEGAHAGRASTNDQQPECHGQGDRAGQVPTPMADADSQRRHGRAGQQWALGGLEPVHRSAAAARIAEFRSTVGVEQWATEPGMGRVAHGVPARVDRLKGLGNAVVPQVAEFVGRLIVAHAERTHQ